MANAIPAAVYPKVMQLILLPTEKCNFRCTYCYEDFKIGKMKRSTIDGVKNLITARAESGTLESLALSWFGGEPLLAKEIVMEISQHAFDLHRAGKIKYFNGDLTTNAYLLTPDLLQSLSDLKQRAHQISLDGVGEVHDSTRQYASGAGTFEKIWENLLAAKASDTDFRITLRLHLTRDNLDSMRELVEKVAETFCGDERFDVFFKTIENLGGPNASQIEKVEKEDAYETVEELTKLLARAGLGATAVLDGPESASGLTVSASSNLSEAENSVGSQSMESEAPKSKFHYEGYICYAAKPNSLVVRGDGSIAKCTVLFDDPRNRVGTINADGTVELDAKTINSVWMRGFSSMDPMELGCPAQNLGPIDKPASEHVIKFEDLKSGAAA